MHNAVQYLGLVFSSYALGRLVTLRLTWPNRWSRWSIRIGLGLGGLGEVFGLLGWSSLLTRDIVVWTPWLLTLLLFLRGPTGPPTTSGNGVRSDIAQRAVFGGVLCVAFSFGFLMTLYPPHHWDETSYHLVLARTFLQHHHLVPVMEVPHPIVPALNHVLFSWGLAAGTDSLPRMVEMLGLVLVLLALLDWGDRIEQPWSGWYAGVLVLSQPLVLWVCTGAYVDGFLVGFTTLGLVNLRLFARTRDPNRWLIAVALLSFATAVKIQGGVFLGPALVLSFFLRTWRTAIGKRRLWMGCLLSLMLTGPWYLFILIHTGNPFWPLFPRLGHPPWNNRGVQAWFRTVHSFGTPRNVLEFLLVPFRTVLQPRLFVAEQRLTPWILLWIAGIPLAYRNRALRGWLGWSTWFTVTWFMASQQLRFLLPIVPLWALMAAETLETVARRTVRLGHWPRTVLGLLIGVITLTPGVAWVRVYLQTHGSPRMTTQERERFLDRFVPGHATVRVLNKMAHPDDTVLYLGNNNLLYFFQPRATDGSSMLLSPIRSKTWRIQSGYHELIPEAGWEDWLEGRGFNWVAVNRTSRGAWTEIPLEAMFLRRFRLQYVGPDGLVYHRDPYPLAVSIRRLPGGFPHECQELRGLERFVVPTGAEKIPRGAWTAMRFKASRPPVEGPGFIVAEMAYPNGHTPVQWKRWIPISVPSFTYTLVLPGWNRSPSTPAALAFHVPKGWTIKLCQLQWLAVIQSATGRSRGRPGRP